VSKKSGTVKMSCHIPKKHRFLLPDLNPKFFFRFDVTVLERNLVFRLFYVKFTSLHVNTDTASFFFLSILRKNVKILGFFEISKSKIKEKLEFKEKKLRKLM
jgi:hypothetical protein